MNKYKLTGIRVFQALSLGLLLASLNARADNMNTLSQQTTVFGKPLGASVSTGIPTGTTQVKSTVGLNVFGLLLEALGAYSNPPNTIGGTTYTEFYSFNKRVFAQSFHYSQSGNLSFNVGLAPAEVRVAAFSYPVGPVLLQVDGGARFQADVNLALSPEIDTGTTIVTNLSAHLGAVAAGAGFAEGYAKFLVVRGGVGGQVDLVDSQANMDARINFSDISHPVVLYSAMVEFLKGRIYAFFDLFSVMPWGWKRLIDHNLYNWNGYCYSAGALKCPGK